METAYEMGWEIVNRLDRAMADYFSEWKRARKRLQWSTSVLTEEDAREYQIRERNAQVEIRDGFNQNLVIQYYEGQQKKILLFIPQNFLLFIPQNWQQKIRISLRKGSIICLQKEPYRGLELSVKKGEILCSAPASLSVRCWMWSAPALQTFIWDLTEMWKKNCARS